MPPWIQPVHSPLPRSLYPILPPFTPYYARTQPLGMPRSYSTTPTDNDTVMMDAQDCEDDSEDLDGTPLDSTTFANDHFGFSKNGNGGFGGNMRSDVDEEDSNSDSEFDPELEDETLDIHFRRGQSEEEGLRERFELAGQADEELYCW
ncbi:hypothetical protein M407DRAFT_7052 [Tulasnella calospora MUT 4182]|uniref:Uncharacterized protein n=1 Tax=Tulasnella calospora MUT 4182 TaxID=1051891 RepID=A0A0C3M2L6_9AGAM|nr:hypothetical protein M407DRAFT_7052 [Tulasnella calospora MUT 4182]